MSIARECSVCEAPMAEASSCLACIEPDRYDDHGCCLGRCDDCLGKLTCGGCGEHLKPYDLVVDINGAPFHVGGCVELGLSSSRGGGA